MDGATLEIRFRDESSPGAGGSAALPLSGAPQAPNYVEQQQNAITAAGGVGASVSRGQPSPPPPTAAAGVEPLAQTVTQIVAADPRATAEELAKALGMKESEVRRLLGPTTTSTGGGPPPSDGTNDDTERLIQQNRRRSSEAEDENRKRQQTQDDELRGLISRERRSMADERERIGTDEQRRQREQSDDLAQLVARERRGAADERERIAQQEAALRPPPPPATPPPVQFRDPGAATQATVNAIAHFAHMGGPLGSALAGSVSAGVAVPGAATALGGAIPALAAAAPYVAVAAAAAAVPAAAIYSIERILDATRGQVQGLSGEVAAAEAQANVRQLLANLRTAQRLGDEVADYVSNRSRIGAAAQGVRDVLVEPLLRDFNNNMNLVTRAAEGLGVTVEKHSALSQLLSSKLTDAVGSMVAFIPYMAYKGGSLLGGWFGSGAEDLKDLNPLKFWEQHPLPDLPAPFTANSGVPVHMNEFEFDQIPAIGMGNR